MTSSSTTIPPPPPGVADWYPLESSPEVLTKLARHWALPERYSFVDVLDLDPELLSFVPRPVHACVLLFPDTPAIVAVRTAEGAGASAAPRTDDAVPLWIPQVGVGHSCGTFATLHALAATRLAPALDGFFDACEKLEPAGRIALLRNTPVIKASHDACVTAGQTLLRPEDWTDCDHFIAFVEHGGRLWEMDGNTPREGPLDRGACGDVLEDTARVVRELYLPHAEGSLNFSLIALVGGEADAAVVHSGA